MSFRRDGKTEHDEELAWEAWKRNNAQLLHECGLPPGVLRSERDWSYLLSHGYWCEDYFGKYITNIDFDLDELTAEQQRAFHRLLETTLNEDEKQQGCAAWHHVCPPKRRTQAD